TRFSPDWAYSPADRNEQANRKLLLLNDLNGLVELEREHGFYRYFDRAALGDYLSRRARACTGSGSDGRTFSAPGDGPNNCTHRRRPSGVFGGSPVRAQPLFACLLQAGGTHAVLLSLNRNRGQVQHEIGGAMNAASLRRRSDHDL